MYSVEIEANLKEGKAPDFDAVPRGRVLRRIRILNRAMEAEVARQIFQILGQ